MQVQANAVGANHVAATQNNDTRIKDFTVRVRCRGLTRVEPRTIRARVNWGMCGWFLHCAGGERVGAIGGSMPRPKAHYSVLLKNHETGEQLKLELIDLPFSSSTRTFRLRVNGRWAQKLPVASKTNVLRQLRSWWVMH